FRALETVAPETLRVPAMVTRVPYVLALITGPGLFVGSALTELVVGFFTTNNSWVDQVAVIAGLAVNVAAFGALWFMLRTGSRDSLRWKLAVALLGLWVVVSVPFGIFGSMGVTP